MKPVVLAPSAPVLLESMRAVGYDASAAVADILDNSVTAGATRVQILFNPGTPRAVAILDDGAGMSPNELVEAMRHGSRSPAEHRAVEDLGRFGLGLKTASTSQCRRLTVVTRRDGATSGMRWDLDDVARERDWIAAELDSVDISRVPFSQKLLEQQSGTLVVWEKLDRLAADDRGDGAVLSDRMNRVGEHLALVFHRYLSGRPQLTIEINEHPVDPVDPFLENDGAIAGPEETIQLDDHAIVLRAFTLPHISRLSRDQVERAGGEQGLRRQQGFYVYRARRLIIWGTWFRLFRQEELTKLTRVRVDVPNALDQLWSLDIKKSAASPPAAVKERLRGLVPTMARGSKAAHHYRGRTSGTGLLHPIWDRIEHRDGIRYAVNVEHPVVAAFRSSLDDSLVSEFDDLLRAVSDTIPIEALYNDRACDRIGFRPDPAADPDLFARLEDLARQMLAAFGDRPAERRRLLNGLANIEPFALHPDLIPRLKERLA